MQCRLQGRRRHRFNLVGMLGSLAKKRFSLRAQYLFIGTLVLGTHGLSPARIAAAMRPLSLPGRQSRAAAPPLRKRRTRNRFVGTGIPLDVICSSAQVLSPATQALPPQAGDPARTPTPCAPAIRSSTSNLTISPLAGSRHGNDERSAQGHRSRPRRRCRMGSPVPVGCATASDAFGRRGRLMSRRPWYISRHSAVVS